MLLGALLAGASDCATFVLLVNCGVGAVSCMEKGIPDVALTPAAAAAACCMARAVMVSLIVVRLRSKTNDRKDM